MPQISVIDLNPRRSTLTVYQITILHAIRWSLPTLTGGISTGKSITLRNVED
jgi:hypothetical protein